MCVKKSADAGKMSPGNHVLPWSEGISLLVILLALTLPITASQYEGQQSSVSPLKFTYFDPDIKAPGISERPLSAASGSVIDGDLSKKTTPAAWMEQNMLSTTDECGDVMDVCENFQKLKISRNNPQTGPYNGAGDGPSLAMGDFMSPDERMAAATNGVTIKSLTSNTVAVVPETHRSSQCSRSGRPATVISFGEEEAKIPPTAVQKSKIQARRQRVKRTEPANEADVARLSKSFQPSLPDEPKKEVENDTAKNNVIIFDTEIVSDVGADIEKDYCVYGSARPSARSTMTTRFTEFELIRPETASSEIIIDGVVAQEDGRPFHRLMRIFEIPEDGSFYNSANDDDDDSDKNRLLQLAKLLYLKMAKASAQGTLYTYKPILGGLHNRLEDFVLRTVPPGFVVKTRVTRVKRDVAGRLFPLHYMHLEREGPGDRKCLLMVAKKCQNFRGISYTLSTDLAELSEKSEYCVGKVCSNFIGTEFTLYAGRPICTHVPLLEKGGLLSMAKEDRFKEALATVIYDPNMLGFKGSRKIKTVIPRMKNILEREVIKPRLSEESLLNQYQNEEFENIWWLRNKDPIWSRETHSNILNFAGRVSTASVRNFPIISNNENDDKVLLHFGRVSENTFSLDFHFPFCPLQAFPIALTSFGSKLACE